MKLLADIIQKLYHFHTPIAKLIVSMPLSVWE